MNRSPVEHCPTCGKVVTVAELVLALRSEDGRRTCRAVSVCGAEHAWMRWADRPQDPLEPAPYPPRLKRLKER